MAVWQWWNCYENLVPTGKILLKINMDETAVRTFSTPKLGLVSLSPKLRRARQQGLHTHPAGRQQQLAAFSHVAFLCDNTQIQAALPQIFIGNEHVLPAHIQQRVLPQLHRNVKLWRRKSAWVDGAVLMEILVLLSESLAPFREGFQPLLLWDAAKAHLRPDVLRCAGRLGLWVIIVPAKITWLLQPADTHCFARYKAFLRQKYLESSAAAIDGRVGKEEIILTMNAAVRAVFQKVRWRESFNGNGFGHQQQHVRQKICAHLQWDSLPQVACSLPNLAQFTHIWPKRLDVPLDALFAAFLPRAIPPARQPLQVLAAAEDEGVVPWLRRLRPRQGSNNDSQESAASSARLRHTPSHPPATAGAPCRAVQPPPLRPTRPGRRQPRAIPPCRR